EQAAAHQVEEDVEEGVETIRPEFSEWADRVRNTSELIKPAEGYEAIEDETQQQIFRDWKDQETQSGQIEAEAIDAELELAPSAAEETGSEEESESEYVSITTDPVRESVDTETPR